jgi:hypothetical protein
MFRQDNRIVGGEVRDFISGGRKSILLLEGSQAMPARPSDKGRTTVKTLESLSSKSCRQRQRNYYFPTPFEVESRLNI